MEKPTPPNFVTLRIQDLARGGAGVARDEQGRVVFVPYTAPGDLVEVEIVETEKNYAQARLTRVMEPSPDRVVPRCAAFGKCGGCQWQHIPYDLQWKTKVGGVKHALGRVQVELPQGSLDELPAERIWEYRNRVQLRGFREELGFYSSGSNTLVPVDRCEIARPEINRVWGASREEGARLPKPYKVEIDVTEAGEVRKAWNARHAALGFRQVHDAQNEKLRSWVAGALSPDRVLFDLFGGQGNLSLGLASRMRRIHCVDVTAPDRLAAPERYRFHRSPVLPWLKKLAASAPSVSDASSAILDPPRIGLGQDFGEIEASLRKLGVSEVVAVGCDPDAWARDVSRFVRRGWKLERVGVLDLFPQTPHVESLAVLRFANYP